MKKLNELQYTSLFSSILSIILLVIAIVGTINQWHISYGYFIILRLVVCASLVTLCFETIPVWLKCALGIQAFLYNPIIPVHIGDRDVWMYLNIIVIPFIIIVWYKVLHDSHYKGIYDTRFLSKKYKSYTIRSFVTILKPQCRKSSFRSPKEVKRYLESLDIKDICEKDAWIFYCLAEKAVKEMTISEHEEKETERDRKIVLKLIQWFKDTGYSERDYRHISPLDYRLIEAESLVFLCKEFKGYFDLEDASHYCSCAVCDILREKGTLEKTLKPKQTKWIESNGMRICVEIDDDEEDNSSSKTR